MKIRVGGPEQVLKLFYGVDSYNSPKRWVVALQQRNLPQYFRAIQNAERLHGASCS